MPSFAQLQKRGAPRAEVGEATVGGPGSDLGERPKDAPIMLQLPGASPKKPKVQAPQDSIDEFWSKFKSKTPGKATTILPKNGWAKKVSENTPKGVQTGRNAVASYEEAAKICKEKVAQIVKECRRVNQKYRDQHFDIDFDLKWGKFDCLRMLSSDAPDPKHPPGEDDEYYPSPGSVKRVGDIFEKPQFYIGGATGNDVRQGANGDCWLLAALCTLGNMKGLIDRVCVARDEQIGVYGFVFHRDGEWIPEVIDDKLYLTKPDWDEGFLERILIEDPRRINSEEEYRKTYQTNSQALYFAQCEDPNETWLPLLEKAYAKAHGDFAAIEGGHTGEGLEDLTGGVTTELFSTDILDKDYFWNEELMKVNTDFLFGCSTGIFGGWGERKGVIEGHAYSIMRAREVDGKRLCLLRNPWGIVEWNGPWSDGSKEWTAEWMLRLDHKFGDDGSFWISYEDLLKKYQVFDRTRLFTDEWKATQQWVSLDVPWSPDYHDTKMLFRLEKKATVVLVLSQLDGRYFCGFSGQYEFELSFRVHKAGEGDYIVRSHGNYCMRRSVAAEIELEAGEYHVLIKVIATKNTKILPVEQVIKNNVKTRPEKLIRIGLSYDLAHAKGQLPEDEKAKKKVEAAKKAKEMEELKDKLMKDKKKSKHRENKQKRKQLAEKEKRKAKAKAKKGKAAAAAAAKGEETADEAEKPASNGEGKVKAAESKEEPKEASTDADKHNDKAESKSEEKEAPAADKKIEKAEEPEPEEKAEVNGAPPPPPPPPEESESEDESDIESVVSDITDGVVEDILAESKLPIGDIMGLPPMDLGLLSEDEMDEFERDPWNAVAVVAFRVYCKDSGVTVEVVRPRDKEQEEGETPSEIKLDVDDSAADATK